MPGIKPPQKRPHPSVRLSFSSLHQVKWGGPFSIPFANSLSLSNMAAIEGSSRGHGQQQLSLSLFAQDELWFWFTAFLFFYDPVPGNCNNCHLNPATLCPATWRDGYGDGDGIGVGVPLKGPKEYKGQWGSAACLAAFWNPFMPHIIKNNTEICAFRLSAPWKSRLSVSVWLKQILRIAVSVAGKGSTPSRLGTWCR